LPVDLPHPSLGDFVGDFWWECWLGYNWGVIGFVIFNLAWQQE
jgi:hypothetical protein